MTWFGKILTFVVLVGSILWMFLTTQAFVARTNWKKRADDYKAAYEEVVKARESEYRRGQASEDSLKRLLLAETTKSTDALKEVDALKTASAKVNAELATLQENYNKADVQATKLQANVDNSLKELDTVRKRTNDLENEAVALVLATEAAKKEEVKAKNQARLALAIADDNAKKVEELALKVSELRASGGGGAQAQVLRSVTKPPPPVLGNLRGQVTNVSGELLTISVGIDAGMAVGTVLDVIRLEGGGKYIGTVKVTSALNLFPKQAIVTFTPARRDVPMDRLPIGDLPKSGDQVRPPEALTGGR
jgi:alanyl-tRNA synthetase